MEPTDKSGAEKRQFKRFPVAFPVLYTVKFPFLVRVMRGNSGSFALAQDIGEGGIALLTNFEIPVDALLLLKFSLINDAVLNLEDHRHGFELDAQVRYCVKSQESTYRIGVNFINILPSDRAYIANYIRINSLIHNPKA